VTTNAKNKPDFRLSLGGNFIPVLEFEPVSIRLSAVKDKDTGITVTIKTAKKNFKVTGIQFKETGKDLDWKAFVPVQFSMSALDSTGPAKDTARVKKPADKGKRGADQSAAKQAQERLIYKLKITCNSISKSTQYGDFVIKTNLPEKPEIKISGVLDGQ
jgi:hypothetical protein